MRYHTLDNIISAEGLSKIADLLPTTLNGKSVLVNGLTARDGKTQINDAGLVEGDIHASNGIIHRIDHVIHHTGAACIDGYVM